jgi:uncharacterized membrane protein YeaQ/YmgE (transglycosylase-associated protein family)
VPLPVFLQGGGFGLIGNIVVGILGPILAGYLFPRLCVSIPISDPLISAIVVSAVGAVRLSSFRVYEWIPSNV